MKDNRTLITEEIGNRCRLLESVLKKFFFNSFLLLLLCLTPQVDINILKGISKNQVLAEQY